MRVTVDFEEEIEFAVQKHLDDGTPVKDFIRAAVKFYRDAYKQEQGGKSVGFGDSKRFSDYNTVMSPFNYLANI